LREYRREIKFWRGRCDTCGVAEHHLIDSFSAERNLNGVNELNAQNSDVWRRASRFALLAAGADRG
jgi:hypothetical protein